MAQGIVPVYILCYKRFNVNVTDCGRAVQILSIVKYRNNSPYRVAWKGGVLILCTTMIKYEGMKNRCLR